MSPLEEDPGTSHDSGIDPIKVISSSYAKMPIDDTGEEDDHPRQELWSWGEKIFACVGIVTILVLVFVSFAIEKLPGQINANRQAGYANRIVSCDVWIGVGNAASDIPACQDPHVFPYLVTKVDSTKTLRVLCDSLAIQHISLPQECKTTTP